MAPAKASDLLEPISIDSITPPQEVFLAVGDVLGDGGRYRIAEVIAVGGMSTVYRALDTRLRTECAVKTLYLPAIESSSEAMAFKREAEILAALRYPGIVNVRDFFAEKEFAILVMDFIEGQNIYDRHRRTCRPGEDAQDLPISPIPDDQVALYGMTLAATLSHLHTRTPAIIYRDLKPHNIMRRTSDGSIILLDFGIARRLKTGTKRLLADDLGTPGYAAPEQYQRDGKIGPQTDIYSLGVVLCELATGYNPRADGAPRVPPPVRQIRPSLSPALAEILQKCLAPSPSDRYQTAGELHQALEEWQNTPRSIRRMQEPKKLWSFRTTGNASGELKALGSSLFFGDSRGTIYGVELESGKPHARLESPERSESSGTRYHLCGERGQSGSPIISFMSSSATTSDLTIYRASTKLLTPLRLIQSTSGRLLTTITSAGTILIASSEPAELAVLTPASDGHWQSAWRVKLPVRPINLTQIDGDPLILDEAGTLLRLSSTGSLLWRYEFGASIGPRAIYANAGVVVLHGGKSDGSVSCFDSENGSMLWQSSGIGHSLSPGVICHESMFAVPTRDAGLVIFDLESGEVLQRVTEFALPIVGACALPAEPDMIVLTEYGIGARIILYDAVRRRVIWSSPLGNMGAVARPLIHAGMLFAQEVKGIVHSWKLDSGGGN